MGGMLARPQHTKVRAPGDSGSNSPRKRSSQSTATYKYLFYVDFLDSIESPNAANALRHLQEITTFFRVLGSYPRGGALIGLENLGPRVVPTPVHSVRRRRVGII